MHEIILEVERTSTQYYSITLEQEYLDISESIGASASLSALKTNAKVIVCFSTTGKTATQIANFRPKAQIVAVTYMSEALNRLELVWGIQTLLIHRYKSSEEAMEEIEGMLIQYGLCQPGDKIVVTLGVPVQQGTKTNTMRIHTVRERSVSSKSRPLRFQTN